MLLDAGGEPQLTFVPRPPVDVDPALTGTTWILTGPYLLPDTRITLTFDQANASINGNDGFLEYERDVSPFGAVAGAGALTLGDYDRDGIVDLVRSSDATDEVALMKGTGIGSWIPRDTDDGGRAMFLAGGMPDFDGDGYADVLAVEGGSTGSVRAR